MIPKTKTSLYIVIYKLMYILYTIFKIFKIVSLSRYQSLRCNVKTEVSRARMCPLTQNSNGNIYSYVHFVLSLKFKSIGSMLVLF